MANTTTTAVGIDMIISDLVVFEDSIRNKDAVTATTDSLHLDLDQHPFYVVRGEGADSKFIAAFSNWQCAMKTVEYHRYDLQDPEVRLAQ